MTAIQKDEYGYEFTEEPCSWCGAVPFEPCIDMRGGGGGQVLYGSGSHTTAAPGHRQIKRVHAERRDTP